MSSRQKRNTPLIVTGSVICISGIAFFLAMHMLSVRDAAGSETDAGGDLPGKYAISEPSYKPHRETGDTDPEDPLPEDPPEDETAPHPAALQAVPPPKIPGIDAYRVSLTGEAYTSVAFEESDIYKGFLVLVNDDAYYAIPDDLGLVSISAERTSSYRVNSASQRLRGAIMPHLNDMMDAFMNETGKTYMYIISGYRDYSSQTRIYNQYINEPGRASRAGHSEHHTGLALDFAVLIDGVQYPYVNYEVARNWYFANSYRFGFIMRYPAAKTSITNVISEPWHYRYVGLPHSYIMHSKNWALEEYIENIKEYSYDDPLSVEYGGTRYDVYYSGSTTVTVPLSAGFDISGNNIDGFIVTIYDRYDRLTNVSAQ